VTLPAESIELFIEEHAFLQSYDSSSLPSPSPLSRQQIVSLSQSSCVSPVEFTDRGGGELSGRGAKSYDRKKAWPCINYSILFAYRCCLHSVASGNPMENAKIVIVTIKTFVNYD
jgi:hypothetical protein